MAIKTDKRITTRKGVLQELHEVKAAIKNICNDIDIISGNLCSIDEALLNVPEGSDTDIEALRDFYLKFPTWNEVEEIIKIIGDLEKRVIEK